MCAWVVLSTVPFVVYLKGVMFGCWLPEQRGMFRAVQYDTRSKKISVECTLMHMVVGL